MKLLWIFTLAISIFFAYHTYTHTRLRYKDLESVMQQNLAVEKGIKTTQRDTKRQYVSGRNLVEKQGNNPKDVALLQKATNIKKYTATVLQNMDSLAIPSNLLYTQKTGFKDELISVIQEYSSNAPKFLAQQDSSLHGFTEPTFIKIDNQSHYLPFALQNNLALKYKICRVEWKANDKIILQVGGVVLNCRPIIAMASAKSQIVKIGASYQAVMFIDASSIQIRPEMKISEGKIKVYGDVGEIEIPNVKAQNYNSEGKATKTLTGKITIMKADGSDTTFTLSTNYTVKKLVN
jgi:hypothetical protein